MLYPTHPVAGYLLAILWKLPALPVVVGAALPDLIDKPLASAGITNRYHTLAHSLVGLLIPAFLARRNRLWRAVFIGWLSHLALDVLHMVLNGRGEDSKFLLWPFVSHESQVQLPPVEFAAFYGGTRSFVVELGIWAAFVAVLTRKYLFGNTR